MRTGKTEYARQTCGLIKHGPQSKSSIQVHTSRKMSYCPHQNEAPGHPQLNKHTQTHTSRRAYLSARRLADSNSDMSTFTFSSDDWSANEDEGGTPVRCVLCCSCLIFSAVYWPASGRRFDRTVGSSSSLSISIENESREERWGLEDCEREQRKDKGGISVQ